jgi:hypothetical protein
MAGLPPVPCPYCGARRNEACKTKSGKPIETHQRRIALAKAPPPRKHVWQGFAYRIICFDCGVPVSVDTTKMIIAHPTRAGTEWCLMSHKPDVNGKKVE